MTPLTMRWIVAITLAWMLIAIVAAIALSSHPGSIVTPPVEG